MSARARVAALAALIAAAAIAWLGTAGRPLHAPGGDTGGMASAPKTSPEPASVQQASGSASMPQGTSAASGPSAAAEPEEEALLARWRGSSLGGSEVDGVITLDAEGRPLPDAGLRRRFDYALALLGEFSLGEIRALVGHWARQAHGDAVAAEVLRLFDRYLALKQAESRIDPGLDPALRLERLARLRRDHFGAAAEAMFGEEEALARETLARLARGTDPDAGASARSGAEDTAPLAPAEPPPRTLARTPALLAEHEALLAATGADPERRHAERTRIWGEEAAQRLAELDQAEADWQARLRRFAEARARLLADPGLAPHERDAELERLLAAGFSEAEQRRLRSLLRIGALPGGG